MVTLHIDLQDGFAEDIVRVRINGEDVFRKDGVGTKLLLGLADSFTTEVEQGAVVIEIHLDSRAVEETIQLDISSDTYLGISVVDGKIEHIASVRPFGYG